MALIDTGASKTAVDESIISILEISPNGETTMGTAAGLRKASLHAVQTSFPAMMTQGIFLPQAVSCDLSGQKVPGGQLAVLLGRDLLRHFLMIYNGPRDRVTLLPG